MNKKLYLLLIALALTFTTVPGRLSAQTDATVSAGTSVAVSEGDEVDSTTSGETTKPTRWRLFFLGVKERLSLLTTFDPVAKAEKALKFAEERAKIAERLADKTDDPKAQERLDKILKRSEELGEQADKIKDKLLENPDARGKLLLKNLLNFKEHKEEVFLKLEEKLSPEQLEKLKELRTQSEDKGKTLMNALENANLPEDVRSHLEEVKARIDEHQEEVKDFQEAQKALLGRIKSGDESAKEKLKTLREKRGLEIKQNLEQGLERREETKAKREEQAADHPAAERKLEQMQKREVIIKENAQKRQEAKPIQKRPLLPLREKPQN